MKTIPSPCILQNIRKMKINTKIQFMTKSDWRVLKYEPDISSWCGSGNAEGPTMGLGDIEVR